MSERRAPVAGEDTVTWGDWMPAENWRVMRGNYSLMYRIAKMPRFTGYDADNPDGVIVLEVREYTSLARCNKRIEAWKAEGYDVLFQTGVVRWLAQDEWEEFFREVPETPEKRT